MTDEPTPTPPASSMEEVAEQYAFYVHESRKAKEELESAKTEFADMMEKKTSLFTEVANTQRSLTNKQEALKEAEEKLKAYEDKESEKLDALKTEANTALAKQREHEAILDEKEKGLETREKEATRTEFQLKSRLQGCAATASNNDSNARVLDEREDNLKAKEASLAEKVQSVGQREGAVSDREKSVADDLAQVEATLASNAKTLKELDGVRQDVEQSKSLNDAKVTDLSNLEIKLRPIKNLYTEFRALVLKYGGDDERVKEWLDSHINAQFPFTTLAATTRAELRASLKRKTAFQLTVTADLDLFLDLADRQVQSDWSQFDKSILRYAKDSAVTDASGILLMDADFVEMERVEDAGELKYPRIQLEQRYSRTGYYYAGWGNSNTQRQLQVMKNGTALASTTMYFFAMKLSLMGSGASAEPVIPEEFRDLIAVKAAELWYLDQSPPIFATADKYSGRYNGELERARRAYRTIDDEPVFMNSRDPDAGGGGTTIIHRT